MKKAIILLLASGLIWAAESEQTAIGQRSFEKQGNVWVQTNLPDQYTIAPDHSATYMDATWNSWFEAGNSEIKMILELGPNVVFTQGESVYRVRSAETKAASIQSPNGNPLFGTNPAFSGLTQAGAVLVDINMANDDTSQDAKK
ncbi:MAG: hypothetical protein KDC71_21865 [Acidobacteria bacterium]|nr:hypothetical protein [Acidobacteriota bacterium]